MTHGDVPEGLAETLTAAIHKRTDFTSVSVIEKEIPFVDLHAEAAAAGITLVDPAAQDAVEDEGEYMDRDALIQKVGAAIYIILDAGMGSGKTEACVELVKHLRGLGWSVLWVTMRCSQVDSIGDRLTSAWAAMPAEGGTGRPVDFAKYNQDKSFGGCGDGLITSEEFPHVIVEWESIHRVQGYYDLIICDEIRSTIATVNSSTNGVNGSHRQFHLDHFDDLMRHCRMFVAMDADCGVDGAVDDVIFHVALDRAKKEALDALRDANETEGTAREAALQKAMAMQRIADSGDVSSLIHKVVRKTQKISRDVVQMQDLAAIDSVLSMAREGKRLGLLCLGKARAKDLKSLLEDHVQGSIGVYHRGSTNLDDVKNINAAWDKHQIIIFTSCITAGPSYEGEIDAIFLFPCLNVATARAAHQMCGRFRNVKSNTIFVGVSGVAEEDVEGVTRHGLEKAFKLELLKLRYGNKAFAVFTDEVKDQLAASGCAYPAMVQRKTFSSPPLLQKIIAYDLVERSYTQTSGKWLSYFKYMATLKGYSWDVNEAGLEEQASIDLKTAIKEVAEARKDARETRIAEVAVEPFMDDSECYANLQKDAAAKVAIAHDMPDTSPKKITAVVIDTVARSGTALTCQRILAASGGDAALLQDTYELYTRQGSETLRVSPHHAIMLCDMLIKAMGLEGVHDRKTPVVEEDFDKKAVESVLKKMATVRMCRKTTCSLDAVKGVLERALGYNVLKNKPLHLTKPIAQTLQLYPPLDMDRWFQARNGEPAGRIGEFIPSTMHSTVYLGRLKALLAVPPQLAEDDPCAWETKDLREEATNKRWCKRRAVVNEVMREQDMSDSEFIDPPMEWEALNVKYTEKDAARAAGAKWDCKTKSWYADTPYALVSLTDVQPDAPSRLWLNIAYDKRDRAKRAGGVFDGDARCWYARDAAAFQKLIRLGIAATPNPKFMAYAAPLLQRDDDGGFAAFDTDL
ncbi:origin of replication binding protein-domain-containing protein [Tribonema minus]|uniref:Origin of replication binding protein-domain-containing protein n=1 Tax=Tribonema minus TaxID=303371 RepID=A0A836CHH5_9STRA|nr:origin of replication binding protein-domain-containing protein [Tribonema minus]